MSIHTKFLAGKDIEMLHHRAMCFYDWRPHQSPITINWFCKFYWFFL